MWYEIPEDELSKQGSKQLEQLRTARANARREARSGNPAKRFPALRAVAQATTLIGAVYTREGADR